MRFTIIFSQLLATAGLMAAALDSKLLTLIPDDARFIIGVDLTLYRRSALAEMYPSSLDGITDDRGTDALQQVQQVVVVERDVGSGRGPLFILSGALASLSSPLPTVTLLDSKTAISADPETVREVVRRWDATKGGLSEVAAKVKSMSESYDNWFLAIRPFESLDDRPGRAAPSKYRAEFKRMVEEALGGIRLGRTNELRAEVTMKTSEDAAAVAALGRWLPGFIQMQDSASIESGLVELAENLVISSTGRTVALSFSLDEAKLDDLVKVRRARQKEQFREDILQ